MSASSLEGDGGKAKLDIDKVSEEWETVKAIRHELQNDQVLFPEEVKESIKSACVHHVHALLVPLLRRMVETPGAPQPGVYALRDELANLYKACSINKSSDDPQVVHDSWMVRKFLGLVKLKARISKPSTVP